GNCEQKYTPTPLERTSRTTCSMRWRNAGGASSNSRWASSKMKASFGLSRSPTSGRLSNSSPSSHSRKVEYSRGLRISWSAARMPTTPRPSWLTRMMSASSSAGSPKNCSPPSWDRRSRARWIAATVCALTRPYSAETALRSSATRPSSARRSSRSSSSRPRSSASLNTMSSTPAWVSLSSRMRASRVGPISLTVVRTGWPSLPYRSQNTTGLASGAKSCTPIAAARAASFPPPSPATARPETSPFTSATNTGTPIREKPSARVIRVTVLPVPVAPATRPWRLARAGSRVTGTSSVVPLPSRIGSMEASWIGLPGILAAPARVAPVAGPGLPCRSLLENLPMSSCPSLLRPLLAVLLLSCVAPEALAQRVSARDRAAADALVARMDQAESRYRAALVLAANGDPRGADEGNAALEDMEDVIDACVKQRGCPMSDLLASYKRLLKDGIDAGGAGPDEIGDDDELLEADPALATDVPEAVRAARL